MLTKIEVRNTQGGVLTLEMEDVSDGYVLQNVDGLDPVRASLVSSSFAQVDGAQFQAASRDSRNIKMTIGLEPDYSMSTVRGLRNALYAYFMPKAQIGLRLYMVDDITGDPLTVNIAAVVETMETSLFSRDPAVDISLMCFDPDFLATDAVALSGSTVSDTTETTITYEGSIATGFEWQLSVDRSVSAFTLYMRTPDGTIKTLDFAASLILGDLVTISSVLGNKSVTLLRSGTTSSLLYAMSVQSDFLELQPGENYFRAYATGAAIGYTIGYTPRYGGL